MIPTPLATTTYSGSGARPISVFELSKFLSSDRSMTLCAWDGGSYWGTNDASLKGGFHRNHWMVGVLFIYGQPFSGNSFKTKNHPGPL